MLSYVQTDSTTPNIVGPTMLGVVASVLAVLCKRMQRLPRMFGAAVLSAKDTGFKLCATTPNNMQTDMQTNATCNIQQCLELLGNNVATVCTGLKGAVSRQSSSFCLVLPITRPQSLWNLK